MAERVPLGEALVAGLRRAGVHVVRAGYELVRGGMVLAEELATALSQQADDPEDDARHIVVEADDEEAS